MRDGHDDDEIHHQHKTEARLCGSKHESSMHRCRHQGTRHARIAGVWEHSTRGAMASGSRAAHEDANMVPASDEG